MSSEDHRGGGTEAGQDPDQRQLSAVGHHSTASTRGGEALEHGV